MFLLAIDPFLQSVIDYPGKLVFTDLHNATVGVATRLDIGDWYVDGEMYVDREKNKKIGTCVIPYQDRSMSATSMLGFIDGSTSRLSQPTLLSCATGNCTWTYSTLAICSRCEDITSLITTETVEVRDSPLFEACALQSYTSYASDYLTYRVEGSYNLSLCAPEGNLAKQNASHSSPGEYGFGRTKKVRLAAGLVSSPQETYCFNTSDTLLASMAVLYVSDDYWARKTPFRDSAVGAAECSLTLCTQLFEAEMKLGEMKERLLPWSFTREPNSFMEIKDPSLGPWIDDDAGISLSRRGPFFDFCRVNYQDNMTEDDLQLLINRTDLQLHMFPEENAGTNVQTTFNITHKAIDTMVFDLKTNLAPRLVDFLSSSGNITQTFERAAKLMSYHMREAVGGGSSTAVGETQQWVTYIRVRLGYMLLPIVLSITIAVFAVRATMQSYRLGLNDVKGDTISSMLLVDGHTRDVLRLEPGGGWRDEAVRGLRLQLGRDEKGVYLEEQVSLLPVSD